MIHGTVSLTSRWREKMLRWSPTVELRDGLKKTISYFEAQLRSSEPLRKSASEGLLAGQL